MYIQPYTISKKQPLCFYYLVECPLLPLETWLCYSYEHHQQRQTIAYGICTYARRTGHTFTEFMMLIATRITFTVCKHSTQVVTWVYVHQPLRMPQSKHHSRLWPYDPLDMGIRLIVSIKSLTSCTHKVVNWQVLTRTPSPDTNLTRAYAHTSLYIITYYSM